MKLRIRYSKFGKVRFVGHRDVARIVERALRRSGLPTVYSEGFSPRMRLSFGLALPTCYESSAEFVDVPLGAEPDGLDGGLACQLTELLPTGFAVTATELVEGQAPSLQQSIDSCDWRCEVGGVSPAQLASEVCRLLASPTLAGVRIRKGQETPTNLRPAIHQLKACGTTLQLRLTAKPKLVRPSEVVELLKPTATLERACRTAQWTQVGDQLFEPITAQTGAPPLPDAPSRSEELIQ